MYIKSKQTDNNERVQANERVQRVQASVASVASNKCKWVTSTTSKSAST